MTLMEAAEGVYNFVTTVLLIVTKGGQKNCVTSRMNVPHNRVNTISGLLRLCLNKHSDHCAGEGRLDEILPRKSGRNADL